MMYLFSFRNYKKLNLPLEASLFQVTQERGLPQRPGKADAGGDDGLVKEPSAVDWRLMPPNGLGYHLPGDSEGWY
jgi:hypothetical protein